MESGPIHALQMIPLILETASKWKPYQAQIVMKRYFFWKYSVCTNLSQMIWPAISTVRLPGPGTLFWFGKLTPEAFACMRRLSGEEDDSSDSSDSSDEEVKPSKTMVNAARLMHPRPSRSCSNPHAVHKHILASVRGTKREFIGEGVTPLEKAVVLPKGHRIPKKASYSQKGFVFPKRLF